MGRGKHGFLDELAGLPWPAGLVVGVVAGVLIGYVVPALLERQGGLLAQAFTHNGNMFRVLGVLVLLACSAASLASWLRARRRRQLLDTRTGLDSLATLGWRDFERLTGEAFRRQGYVVEETGLGGADGGIDLILHRDGRRTLVQCKQWRRERVPVNVVREMYGLMTHHNAHTALVVALGGFTPDAARFAAGKSIELMDGGTLLAMVRNAQVVAGAARTGSSLPEQVLSRPDCPRCGTTMVERTNRRTGSVFWGCASYPACRGTR